jgi:hypothetical protein
MSKDGAKRKGILSNTSLVLFLKEDRNTSLYSFTRICGVLYPPLEDDALDFLLHQLIERIWSIKLKGNIDKRKFPQGVVETAKAENLFVTVQLYPIFIVFPI